MSAERKTFSRPDETRTFGHGRLDLVDVAGAQIGMRRRRAGRGGRLVGGDRLRAGVTCGPPLIRGPGGCLIGPCCGLGSSGGSVSR